MCGSSGMVIARHPLAATRRTSSATSCGSQIGGMASGMNRSGYAAHHSSMCQSLYAWTRGEREVLVGRFLEHAAR